MKDDPIIERIRNVRKKISVEYKNDPEKLGEHYLEYQKKFEDRLVNPNNPPPLIKEITASDKNYAEKKLPKI